MSYDARQPTDHEAAPGLRTPEDLVAAVPYLLGFHPADSLVLVSTRTAGQPGVEFTLRVDLPPPELVTEMARELAGVVLAQRCDELLLVVVGGAAPGALSKSGSSPGAKSGSRAGPRSRRGRVPEQRSRPALGPPRAEVVAEVMRACAEVGVLARAAIWVAGFVAGTPWRCYGACGCVGALPDPACSPVATASVLAGQVTYADRAELERVVAPAAEPVLLRRADLLTARLDELSAGGDPMPPATGELVAALEHWIDVASAGRPQLADEDVVRLCLALGDPLVRDAAFGSAYDARAEGAERLWTALVTESPDPEAAEAAVLLAHSALIRGDGALAGIALARAQQAWPGHRLSAMIRSALDAGLGPDQLRDWFVDGSQRATELLDRRLDRR
ncbi:MAG TPA: DUF4192 domain-containing protein [Pseudonocardia sp.]|nr:DUF4192 domain-containing protein [Pseudonocardia sp.]